MRLLRPGAVMAKGSTSLLAMASLATVAVAKPQLPYMPAQILMPTSCFDTDNCDGADMGYIFRTNPDSSTITFSKFDYSEGIDGNDAFTTATKDLPFLEGGAYTRSFAAARAGDGKVLVFAGDCDQTGGSELWAYSEDNDWEKLATNDDTGDDAIKGPGFLGATVAFSGTIAPEMEEARIFTYGGMCPTESGSGDNVTSWQNTANYSKSLVELGTQGGMDVKQMRAPRWPMAGFTMTSLTPSRSNASGTVTQEVGFVVLGGHTARGFINIYDAAVWRLPDESWEYIHIEQPGDDEEEPSKELAVKAVTKRNDVVEVNPRSGHSAVLSEDGKSIIVLGGWVGDITNASLPQLAVLEMGQTQDDWKWTIPENQPEKGIYGHGATMLPGNIMMVVGGWETKGSSKSKRQDAGSDVNFLNLTSMEWSQSYTNPRSASAQDAPDSKSADSKTIRLGLGLGLGLGIGLIILLIIGFFCWRRHKKQKEKHSRDSAIQALQQDAHHFRPSLDDEMMERDYPWTGGWYTGGNDAYQSGNQYENLRGDRGNMSMGTSAMSRKGAPRGVMRAGYAPAGGTNTGMGMILEDDEDEYRHMQDLQTPSSELPEDPFATPMGNTTVITGGSHAAEGKQRRRYDPDVQDWVSEADVAESLLTRMNSRRGRVSPTRRNSGRSAHLRDDDSRNGSNLSESSTKLSPAGRRTPFSGTSGLMAGSTTLAGSDVPKPGSSSSGSYTTAKSGFNNLQAEGPSLLMGQHTGYNHDEDEEEEFPSSPSKSKPRRNWLGSLRRVFSTSGNTSPESSHREPDSPMEYMHTIPGDYEVRPGLSGELLRRKQGRHDWDLAHQANQGDAASEKDWDIERAVENRLVQVMFSVPKERLRVVNPDDEDAAADAESIKRPQSAKIVNPDRRGAGDSSERSESLRTTDSDSREGDLGMLRVGDHTSGGGSVRGDSFETGRGISALSMVSSGGRSDAQIEVAEAVRVQKPRTRVLRMAESFEQKSREGSPSPTRGAFF